MTVGPAGRDDRNGRKDGRIRAIREDCGKILQDKRALYSVIVEIEKMHKREGVGLLVIGWPLLFSFLFANVS